MSKRQISVWYISKTLHVLEEFFEAIGVCLFFNLALTFAFMDSPSKAEISNFTWPFCWPPTLAGKVIVAPPRPVIGPKIPFRQALERMGTEWDLIYGHSTKYDKAPEAAVPGCALLHASHPGHLSTPVQIIHRTSFLALYGYR